MVDPWLHMLQMLAGALVVPMIAWPAQHSRLVVAPEDSPEPTPAEALVLEILREAPRTPSEIAEALAMKRATVDVRMMRMARKGHVVHVGRAWGIA